MNFDEKMAEEYKENAEYIEIDDYGHKVYGSLDIEQAFLDALRKGSQLDMIYDISEGKWVNRNSELEKKYDTSLKEKLEKEAGDYAEKHAFRVPYDGSNKFYDDIDFKASKEGYIAGAEPREEIIAKLEEQNKNQAESLGVSLLEEEKKAKRIKDLEKENADLKEQLGNVKMQKAGEKSDLVWKLKTANEQKTEKLTKAKEIMQKLIANAPDTYSGTNVELQQKKMFSFQDAINKAEQFLKEDM